MNYEIDLNTIFIPHARRLSLGSWMYYYNVRYILFIYVRRMGRLMVPYVRDSNALARKSRFWISKKSRMGKKLAIVW